MPAQMEMFYKRSNCINMYVKDYLYLVVIRNTDMEDNFSDIFLHHDTKNA